MSFRARYHLRAAFSILAFAMSAIPAAFGGTVRVLGTPGTFVEIQPAVDAAPEGGILLVESGAYGPFVIANKSLSVFAAPGADVQVLGVATFGAYDAERAVLVTNLGASQSVLLVGLKIQGACCASNIRDGQHAVVLKDDVGPVHLQACTLTGGAGQSFFTFFQMNGRGGAGAKLFNSPRVSLKACILRGGNAAGTCWQEDMQPIGDGGDAFSAVNNVGTAYALAYESEFHGGHGGFGGAEEGSDGGAAYRGPSAVPHSVHLVGCSLQGGDAGWTSPDRAGGCYANPCGPDHPGDGGHGLYSPTSIAVHELDNDFQGGPGGNSYIGDCGAPGLAQFGPLDTWAGSKRSLSSIEHVVLDTSPLIVTIAGEPGDTVRLTRATTVQWQVPEVGVLGLWVLDRSSGRLDDIGTIRKLNSAMNREVKVPDLPAGVSAAVIHLQARVTSASGQVILTNPLSILVLNQAP